MDNLNSTPLRPHEQDSSSSKAVVIVNPGTGEIPQSKAGSVISSLDSSLGILRDSRPLSASAGPYIKIRQDTANQALVTAQASDTAKVLTPELRRAVRYRLRRVARKIFLADRERVCICGRRLVLGADHVEIWHNAALRRHSRRNLIACGSVWMCPVCAAKISEFRRRELSLALALNDYFPVMVTFTLRHDFQALDESKSALKSAIRFFRSGKRYQTMVERFDIIGNITSFEGTHTLNAGWHPHLHLLFLTDKRPTDADLLTWRTVMFPLWLSSLTRFGFDADAEHGLTVIGGDIAVAEYVAKWGKLPQDENWGPVHELVKATSKQSRAEHGRSYLDMLADFADGDQAAGDLAYEWGKTMKGDRQLRYSPGLKDTLGIADIQDEQIAAMEDARGVLLGRITQDDWLRVVKAGKEAEFDQAADTGDIAVIRALLHPLNAEILEPGEQPGQVVDLDTAMWDAYERAHGKSREVVK